MAHVVLRHNEDGTSFIEVDGVDLSMHVFSGTVQVTDPGDFGHPWRVALVIAADSLEIDLPDAVVDAVRAEAS